MEGYASPVKVDTLPAKDEPCSRRKFWMNEWIRSPLCQEMATSRREGIDTRYAWYGKLSNCQIVKADETLASQ